MKIINPSPDDKAILQTVFEKGVRMGKKMVTNWTPVTDELPPEGEMVLVSTRTKKGVLGVNRAYYSNGSWHGSGSMSGVTAWRLLPEPYKGGDV